MNARELAHGLRSIVLRAVARASADTGESQTLDVTIAHGVDRSAVEVLQPFGLASRAPAGGAVIVLAVGGDTGDLVALPAGMPGLRLGGLGEGESAIYSVDGSRVHCKVGGVIEIRASSSILVKVGGAVLEVTADKIKGEVGGSRFVATEGAAKLVSGDNYLAVAPAGITSSVPVVVGPDPTPGA